MDIYSEIRNEIMTMKIARNSKKEVKLYKPLLILAMLDYHMDNGSEESCFNNPTDVEKLVDFFTIYLENSLIKDVTYNSKGNSFRRKDILYTMRDMPLRFITNISMKKRIKSEIFLNDFSNNPDMMWKKRSTPPSIFEIRVPQDSDLGRLCLILRSACYERILKETGLLIQDSIVTDLGKNDIERSAYYRVGQNQYRRKMIEKYECKCAFCNFDVEHTLIASHAKRWVDCKNSAEKLSENNGFLLCATHDKMFDRGYLTVNPYTKKYELSPELTEEELKSCMSTLPDKFNHEINSEMAEYLRYHVDEIFRNTDKSNSIVN